MIIGRGEIRKAGHIRLITDFWGDVVGMSIIGTGRPKATPKFVRNSDEWDLGLAHSVEVKRRGSAILADSRGFGYLTCFFDAFQ